MNEESKSSESLESRETRLPESPIHYLWGEKTTPEKIRWFQSLSPRERMDVFDAQTEKILAEHPEYLTEKKIEPIPGRIQVLSLDSNL